MARCLLFTKIEVVNHTIPGKIRDKIASLALTKHKGANYSHLSELLREEEGITISQSSVSIILKAKGIKSPRKHKPPKLSPNQRT